MYTRNTLSRRKVLGMTAAAASTALASPLYLRMASAASDVLVVNTFGGPFSELERQAFFDPFTKETGIRVELDTPWGFAKLKAQVEAGNAQFDMQGLNSVDMARAVSEDLIEPIDFDMVDRSMNGNQMFREHGVGYGVLGTPLVYRTDHFSDGGPANFAEFFDVEKFPAVRSLGKRAYTSLAYAMQGAGAGLDELFPFDYEKAFAALDTVKGSMPVFWEGGTQSEQLLRDGEIQLMSMWSRSAVNLFKEGVPIGITYGGAELNPSFYFVSRNAPNKKAAMQMLEFMSRPERQAEFARLTYFGPTNPAAYEFIPEEDAKLMSTNPAYVEAGYYPDADWLTANSEEMQQRWLEWLSA